MFELNKLYKFEIPFGTVIEKIDHLNGILDKVRFTDDRYVIFQYKGEGVDWALIVSNIEDFNNDLDYLFDNYKTPFTEVDISELPLYISDNTTDLYADLIKGE